MNSDDFQWLVKRHRVSSTVVVESAAQPEATVKSKAVEVDSTMDIAKAMIGEGSEVKIAVKNESTTVSSNKERNADVIGRLSELGD